jgi:hypothetical protein
VQFCRIYSVYLFCLYFELFGWFLRPSKEVRAAVARLRDLIHAEPRWPEIVTHEEMNIPPPKLNIFAELARASDIRRSAGRRLLGA